MAHTNANVGINRARCTFKGIEGDQITENIKGSHAREVADYRSADNRLMISMPSAPEASSIPDAHR